MNDKIKFSENLQKIENEFNNFMEEAKNLDNKSA